MTLLAASAVAVIGTGVVGTGCCCYYHCHRTDDSCCHGRSLVSSMECAVVAVVAVLTAVVDNHRAADANRSAALVL